MSQSRHDIVREILEKAVREIIEQLPYTIQVFHNPTYDLNRTVENEMDFLLGGFCASILERCCAYLAKRQIMPTQEEFVWMNHFVFSRAPDFKHMIREHLGL